MDQVDQSEMLTWLYYNWPSYSRSFSVLWKVVMMNGTINHVLVKVAQRTQPKKLAAFMRKMADYIIFTLPEQLDNVR